MENKKKLKVLLISTIIEAVIIIGAVVYIAMSGVLQTREERLLTESRSANGAYVISVYEVGSPNIIHANTVKAYYSDKDHKQGTAVFTAEINNGRDTLDESNYTLRWEGDTAVLYLVGAKQTGTAYKINFETANKLK